MKQSPAAAVTPREQQELKEELKNSHREAVAASANAAFSMKVHKRKRSDDEVMYSYAVHEKATKKQIVQLTTSVKENADEIVDSVVKKLNAGECTKEEAIAEVNAFKPV